LHQSNAFFVGRAELLLGVEILFRLFSFLWMFSGFLELRFRFRREEDLTPLSSFFRDKSVVVFVGFLLPPPCPKHIA